MPGWANGLKGAPRQPGLPALRARPSRRGSPDPGERRRPRLRDCRPTDPSASWRTPRRPPGVGHCPEQPAAHPHPPLWAVAGHALPFDDLTLPSVPGRLTSHDPSARGIMHQRGVAHHRPAKHVFYLYEKRFLTPSPFYRPHCSLRSTLHNCFLVSFLVKIVTICCTNVEGCFFLS